MKSLSFDSMVRLYDETRVFDKECFDSALDFLVERFPTQRFGSAFEPGIGTGRIAIPLAERGYRVTGVDISEDMLALLKKRLAQLGRPLQVSFQKADATELPFSDGAFDMAVVVHVFYFVRAWKKVADEIMRVVRKDGPLVLMHTGTGMEVPFLNERYKELCADEGSSIKSVGVESTREVVEYFQSVGCRAEWVRDRWRWTSRIRLDKALHYMRSRAYSFTSVAPDDIHSAAIRKLESEMRTRFGNLATVVEVPNQVYIVVICGNDRGS